MAKDGRNRVDEGSNCSSEECGFTIFLDERQIYSFMESGDYSSARELEHFNEVGSQLEKHVKEGVGLSVLALTAGKNRLSRDFAVLQIAHVLAKRGKRVLIVDCDFLDPGLNGLVENAEELGFLDLLLYGSSLQSVAHPIGVDGVSVIGSGSFPVHKTMPFAKREFGKINEFLVQKNDVVIYCSTLYTDDGETNPMTEFVDSILYCCRIEKMDEGQLKKNLEELAERDVMVDIVCFSSKEEKTGEAAEEPGAQEPPRDEELDHEPIYIEKMGEIETDEQTGKRRFNLPRFITVVAAVIIVSFIAYWIIITRTIRERESSNRRTELVQKQRDVREAADRQAPGVIAADTAVSEEGVAERTEVGEEPAPEPPVAESPAGPLFAVHVASFKDMERVGAEVSYLEKQGYETRVVEAEVKGAVWFRVLVGEFATREEADEVRRELLALRRISYARVVRIEE